VICGFYYLLFGSRQNADLHRLSRERMRSNTSSAGLEVMSPAS
jgi:hypothetical protein